MVNMDQKYGFVDKIDKFLVIKFFSISSVMKGDIICYISTFDL